MWNKKTAGTLILSLAFLTSDSINGVALPWYTCSIATGFVVFAGSRYRYSRGFIKAMKKVLLIVLLPYFAATAYTLFSVLTYGGGGTYSLTMLRAVSRAVQASYRVVLAAVILLMFREECVDVIGRAMILCYAYSLVIALHGIGAGGVVTYMLNPQKWIIPVTANSRGGINYLERHDLGAAVGMVILYKLFLQDKDKHTPIETFLLFFVMWGCNKRIEMLAFIVAAFFGLLANKFRRIRNLFMNFVMVSVLACCFTYIVLVLGGGLYVLAAKLGLDISGRVGLFRSVSRFYELSLTYMGRGFGFTNKFLTLTANTQEGWALGNAWMAGMHNDIAVTYIDLGTPGSFLWFAHFLLIIPWYFRKHFGNHAKYVYWLMTVFAYVSYTMDNTMFYFMFQLTMSVIVLQGCWKSVNDSASHRKMKGGIVHELQSIGTKDALTSAGT